MVEVWSTAECYSQPRCVCKQFSDEEKEYPGRAQRCGVLQSAIFSQPRCV